MNIKLRAGCRQTSKEVIKIKIRHMRDAADKLEMFLNSLPEELDDASDEVLWSMFVNYNAWGPIQLYSK